jgi:predicted aspartyl protease/uncharacterized protein YecT (DUF1311 family)
MLDLMVSVHQRYRDWITKMIARSLIGLGVLAASFPAWADEPAPTYCATTKHALARTICDTPSLWAIDNEMNRVFDLAIAGSASPAEKKSLRQAQSAYITEIVLKACSVSDGTYSAKCIADTHRTRIAILRSLLYVAAQKDIPRGAGAPEAAVAHEVKIAAINEDNAIYIWGRINGGPRVKMMLDTGASRTFVPIRYAGDVKLRDLAGVGDAVLANGAKEEFLAATLDKIEIGDEKTTAWVANITVGIGGHGDDILLGRDFLKRFKSWSFDESTGTLTITAKQ